MNILIVGPSWVGDMVMAQTLFQCLKQRHPQCDGRRAPWCAAHMGATGLEL